MRGGILVVALPLLVSACEQDRIEVSAPPPGQSHGTYGRAELQAAVQSFSGGGRTPAQYRALAKTIASLQSRFDASTAADAERSLVLLALGPLEAVCEAPASEQLESLALTVWPTVLGEEPAPGETPVGYTERLCGASLAPHCKFVVPEYRPLILSALVWQRFLERVRLAVRTCDGCEGDPKYAEAVARFERREGEARTRATEAADEAHPRRWPVAGLHAAPWPAVPLAEIRADGTVSLAGRDLPPGAWREALGEMREGAAALGVAIEPSAPVARLRALAQAAAAAGFRELAIQARTAQYPYALRGYRMALRRQRGKRPPVRDIDSVQVLVQALEVAAATGKAPLSIW